MGKEFLEDFDNAWRLLKQARSLGYSGGCVEICIASLGGKVHLQDLIDFNEMKMSPLGYNKLLSSIQRRGLEIRSDHQFHSKPDPELIGYILKHPKEFIRYFGGYGFVGCVRGAFLLFGSDCRDSPGHAVAIVNNAILPRNERRRIKRANKFVCIDSTEPDGFSFLSSESISEMIDQQLKEGKKARMVVVTKER